MAKEQWSIYSVETETKTMTGVRKYIYGEKLYHAHLMLVNETTGEAIRELHFTPHSTAGKTMKDGYNRNPLNVAANLADSVGLSDVFTRIVDRLDKGGKLVRFKGKELVVRKDAASIENKSLRFTGSPEIAMGLWNKACHATRELNKQDLPFLVRRTTRPAQNCRSGMEMILEALNLEVAPVIPSCTGGMGRHLYRRFPALRNLPRYEKGSRALEHQLEVNRRLHDEVQETRPSAAMRNARRGQRRVVA